MRQGCRQAANWERARHSRRATKTCQNEDKQRQADTIGSRALCVPPHECCILSAPRFQVHSHRCPLAGRKMHTHWLHVYRCSQLKAYRCPPARLQVQTCRPGSRCRCPQTRCPQARLQVQPCRYPQARLQVQTCRCLPQARLQVCRCQQARLRYIRAVRMGSGSVYTYPPPVTRPNPWAQDIQAKLRSAGPVPSPG